MKPKKVLIGFTLLSGISLGTPLAFATDELYLCGAVEDANLASRLITIDVASGGCRGLRTFKLSQAAANTLTAMGVGGRKCFFINSNTCQAGRTYTITKITPE